MPPAKYSNIDAGGVSFQITQTEKKELKTMIEEMKKLKTLYEAQLKVRERIGTLQKEVTSGQKLETQYHRDRLKTLENIFNRMKQINQISLETLKRENPAVGLAWGRKGTSMGRYDYTPEAAGEVGGATRKKELTNSQKLVGVYDRLKKSYAWQLFYFSSVSILMAGMLSNSKVFGHFMDVIGSALGFIMDMLLVSIIPWVVKLVNFLFQVGQEVAKWPDWVKQIIVLLGLFVLGLMAIKVYTAITETIAAIKAIGAAAKVATGVEGVGGLSGALATLTAHPYFVGISIGLVGVGIMEMLGITSLQKDIGALVGGKKLSYSQAGFFERAGYDYMAAMTRNTETRNTEAGAQRPFVSAEHPVNVNVYLDGDLINQSQMNKARQQSIPGVL